MTTTLCTNQYLNLLRDYEKIKVIGWFKNSTLQHIPQLIIHLVIEFIWFRDVFDDKFIGSYTKLTSDNTIAKDVGAVCRPRSFLNTTYWTWMKSMLSPGEHYRFIKINNIGGAINYGGLIIGIAKVDSSHSSQKLLNPPGNSIQIFL